MVTEICKSDGNLTIVNLYNPCKPLNLEKLGETMRRGNRKKIWCGDFNVHNSLWGSTHTDNNGEVVKELMNIKQLVRLNNGNGTRTDICSNSVLH